jgi:bifunctional DNase/RNase
MRTIFDAGRIGLVLIGMPEIAWPRYPQFYFCVAFRAFVGILSVTAQKQFGSLKASDTICNMSKPVVEVQVRAVAEVSGGCAVFLGNEDKVFVMFVDQSVGAAITMFIQGSQKERPLTHDLLANVLRALGAKIDRVVVNDLKDGTYFARLVLSAENETQQKKIIEIDARPSDCIAMATQQSAPIFVSLDVWDEVEDMTEVLRKIQQEGPDTEQIDEEEES